MNPQDVEQPEPSTAKRKWIAVAIAMAFAIAACAYVLWPAGPLNDMEQRLVGTWRLDDANTPEGWRIYSVYRDDRTTDTVCVATGGLPDESFHGIWAINGQELRIAPQGVDIRNLIDKFYSLLGRCNYSYDPKAIVSLSDNRFVYKNNNGELIVLIRESDQ
jgi:hypothetical protein